jgi:hypothetical protein
MEMGHINSLGIADILLGIKAWNRLVNRVRG